MKKITPKIAKSIALKYFKKSGNKAEQNFAKVHTESVVEIAIILSKKFKANNSIVEISAWLHDIGKNIEMNNHAEHAISLLKKENYEITDIISECILNHGNTGKPKSIEAQIIQMADKLSILNINVLKLLFEQENILLDDIIFFKKMTTESIGYLEKISNQGIKLIK